VKEGGGEEGKRERERALGLILLLLCHSPRSTLRMIRNAEFLPPLWPPRVRLCSSAMYITLLWENCLSRGEGCNTSEVRGMLMLQPRHLFHT